MGYTIKQKMEICLKSESNPEMTQLDLANWAMKEFGSEKPPSQTTISRILNSKNDIISRKESEFELIRRRKRSNPLLRRILTEWITQSVWENLPMTTPIIQSTANGIWTRLPKEEKDGNGLFNQKWCSHFIKKLNINIIGTPEDKARNRGYNLNKVWKLDEILELKRYLRSLVAQEKYAPQDVFVVDDFQLFYTLPLDQIFDVSSIDKGLRQSNSSAEHSVTIMLGCNVDGSEKLPPIIVGKYDKFDVSKSQNSLLKSVQYDSVTYQTLMNKITEAFNLFYRSNTNKWITSSMFQNYLTRLDHKLSNARPNGRKILIILDDCSSHRIINLKFTNIKLVYLKNEANHKNPYNITYSGVKFDYLPMSFGLVEEFKILYRLQQYLEMINIQRNNSAAVSTESSNNQITASNIDSVPADAPLGLEVLSEADYHISLIKAIEWITRSWHSISTERIFSSWKKTHLFDLLDWPTGDPKQLVYLNDRLANFDENRCYNKLEQVMSYLNVVIPWEVDELVGLVNERSKVTLSYASLEEIIDSCLSEPSDQYDEPDEDSKQESKSFMMKYTLSNHSRSTTDTESKDPWFSVQDITNNQFFVGKPQFESKESEDTVMQDIENDTYNAMSNLAAAAAAATTTNQSVTGESIHSQVSSPPSHNGSGYPNNPLKHKLPIVDEWNDKRIPGQQQPTLKPDPQQNLSGYEYSPISNIDSPSNGGSISIPTAPFPTNNRGFESFSNNNTNQSPLFVTSLSTSQQMNVPSPLATAQPPVPSIVQQQQRPQPLQRRSHQLPLDASTDIEMANSIVKILGYSDANTLRLAQSTIDDLEYNLRNIKDRLDHS
ncbi:PDC2 Protein PDC2 [Candida maltosa Xu316]|uniref:Protein PDC2 n=1 Tax=Candida maltosa (strain Xu316) TaxID=1245528 RepID=M3HQ95_CANMX|nr:Protein PDC2 [Candida maltosa Xu316]